MKKSNLRCPKCGHYDYIPIKPYKLDIRICLKCKYKGK